MTGTVNIDDLPDLGTPTDGSLLVADQAGTGIFHASALRDYVLSGSLPAMTIAAINVTGFSSLSGMVGIGGTLTVVGGTHLESELAVDGGATFGSNVDVDGGATIVGRFSVNGALGISANDAGGYLLLNGGTGFSTPVPVGSSSIIINGGGRLDYAVEFFCNSSRIGMWGPNGDFWVTSNGYKPGGGPWLDSSDERIKRDIADYETGLEQILQLRPVSYRFRPETDRENKTHYGLIAQEVESVMPEMVTQGPGQVGRMGPYEDLRTLDTQALIYALLNAVKTLHQRVQTLEAAPAPVDNV